MKGAWKQRGVAAAMANHLGGGGVSGGYGGRARRARLCLYGLTLAFAAFAAFLAFAPSPSSPAAAWFDGLFASASPYRAQVSSFFSSLFPANSSPGPPGGVAARRRGPSGGGFAARGGQAGTNGSSTVRPGERSGSGSGVPTSIAGGVPNGNSASANATAAVQSAAPPNDHVRGGAAANNSTASDVGGAGVPSGVSVQNGTTAKGGVPILINGSDVNASSAEAGGVSAVKANARNAAGSTYQLGTGLVASSNGTAVPFINQTGNAVAAVMDGHGAAPQRSGAPGNNQTVQIPPAANNQNQTGSRAASGGSTSTMNKQRESTAIPQGSASLVKDHSGQAITPKPSNSSAVPVIGDGQPAKEAANAGGEKKVHWIEAMASCDMFYGNWVRDNSYPLYPEGSCPHIDESFNCHLNGRPDKGYQRLRWQPSGCSIPRLNPTDMLERLRGKRLVFVGDSLNRNMWESLVCILRSSIKDKRKVFEVSGSHKFRAEGSFLDKGYKIRPLYP